MFVELLDDFPGNPQWTKGAIVDLPEGIGRGFITAGQGKESDALAHLKASNKAEMERFQGSVLETIRTALASKPAPKGPPRIKTTPDGKGIVTDHVAPGESSEEHGPRRGLTDILRCIALQGGIGTPPEQRDWAIRRLRNLYADGVTTYHTNEATGELTETVTRSMADGGMETITRTGTDSVGGGATYGFAVKPEYLGTVFEIAMEQGVFAPACESIPITQGLEVKYPALGQYSAPVMKNGVMQAAVFAGITLAYKGEVTQRDSSDAALEMIQFKAVDLTAFTSLGRDFIADNYVNFDAKLQRLFGRAFGWTEDWVSIHGDGNGKPQGYFNASCTITGGPNSGARSNTGKIASDDLFWMMSRISPQCWDSFRWIANNTTIPQLAVLTNAAGTPIFQPNALIAQADPLSLIGKSKFERAEMMSRPMGTLIGKPIYFTEKVPTLGNTGDISAVCPDQFGIARREGIEIGLSEHFYFDTDRVAYRFKLRHDMKALWRAPYIQADNMTTPGSGTQVTPFFVLK